MIGAIVGGFKLLDQIGRGATSTVYRGVNNLGTVRAIKIYKPHLFETGSREREEAIKREARLRQERINHPNVCFVESWGRENLGGTKYRFLVSEFIDGVSLEVLIKKSGPFTVNEFLGVARQIVDGLGTLHAAGLIHRDIKPGNVLIETSTGRAVITDFGVIRDLTAATTETSGDQFKGTWHYAAPEAIERSSSDPDRVESDIYSLGATFFEMVTGDRPFAQIAPLTQLADAIRRDPPVLPGKDYPQALIRLVRLMLAKSPEARPNLSEIAEALTAIAIPQSTVLAAHSRDPIAELRNRIAADAALQDAIAKEGRRLLATQLLNAIHDGVGVYLPVWFEQCRFGEIPTLHPSMQGSVVGNANEVFARFPDRSFTGSIFVRVLGMPMIRSVAIVYLLDGLPDIARVLRFFAVADVNGGNYVLEVEEGVELVPEKPSAAHHTIIEDLIKSAKDFVEYFGLKNGVV